MRGLLGWGVAHLPRRSFFENTTVTDPGNHRLVPKLVKETGHNSRKLLFFHHLGENLN